MGGVKQSMLEEESRGVWPPDDSYVCANCLEEEGLQKFIAENATHHECTYCGRQSNTVIACSMESMCEHILKSIYTEYGSADDECVPYDSREGGYQLPTFDTYDLLEELGVSAGSHNLFMAIVNALPDHTWSRRDPFFARQDQRFVFGWKAFCRLVMHTSRYVFFKGRYIIDEPNHPDTVDPVEILKIIGSLVQELDLARTISQPQSIFRVRIVESCEHPSTAKELGAPPLEYCTISNRMSPAGISMFYGAFDRETAIKETYERCDEVKKAVIGEFTPTRPLRVLDFSSVHAPPSIFDVDNRHRRSSAIFLQNFIHDIAKPIKRIARAHIDYVPTQIVTEYLRLVFLIEEKYEVDGIIYPSAKNSGERAIVIFADNNQCLDLNVSESSNGSNNVLRLVKIEERLLQPTPH